MNAPLLNRQFEPPADGWYQIAPLGEFPNVQAGVIQVVDAEACAAMATAFQDKAAALGDKFAGLLIDYDHFSLDQEKSSGAGGWITGMAARPDGLWGQIRWSTDGERDVTGGNYRFLSPVWRREQCLDLGDGKVRPLVLDCAALTNDPNLGGLRPLSNRAVVEKPAIGRDVNIASVKPAGKPTMDYKAVLLKMLGLDAAADDAAIQTACDAMANRCQDLTNRATAAEDKVKAFEVATLNSQVEADLVEFAPVITNREEVKAALLLNREAVRKTLVQFKADRLPNRRDGKLPDGDAAAANGPKPEDVDQYLNRHPGTPRSVVFQILSNRGK